MTVTNTIEPAVPIPSWATIRQEHDHGRMIIDLTQRQAHGFRVEREQLHWCDSIAAGDWRHGPESFTVSYNLVWPDGDSADREQFCLLPEQIPTLIALLQEVQSELVRG